MTIFDIFCCFLCTSNFESDINHNSVSDLITLSASWAHKNKDQGVKMTIYRELSLIMASYALCKKYVA